MAAPDYSLTKCLAQKHEKRGPEAALFCFLKLYIHYIKLLAG